MKKGDFATPWPDKQPLFGEEIINPDGRIIKVPHIDRVHEFQGKEKIHKKYTKLEIQIANRLKDKNKPCEIRRINFFKS